MLKEAAFIRVTLRQANLHGYYDRMRGCLLQYNPRNLEYTGTATHFVH